MSLLGHSLPGHPAPALANVRYAPRSDQITFQGLHFHTGQGDRVAQTGAVSVVQPEELLLRHTFNGKITGPALHRHMDQGDKVTANNA